MRHNRKLGAGAGLFNPDFVEGCALPNDNCRNHLVNESLVQTCLEYDGEMGRI
jgi:hypothetical protein